MAFDVVLIDGQQAPATLPLDDDGATRGDGAFESVGVWDGRPFRLNDHLARLRRSVVAIGLPEPDLRAIRDDVGSVVDGAGDAMVRIYVTAGGRRIVARLPQPERIPPAVLVPQLAPWIRPLGSWGPAGAKSMSYAPNIAATRAAQRAGGDDALLVTIEGWVAEGPNFAVAWAADDVVRAPDRGLGIVDSVSRRAVLELVTDAGVEVEEGRWSVSALERADEVWVVSAVRPLLAVRRIGATDLPAATPLRDRFADALEALRRGG